uniref:bifunctional metallophosphatase/5'-nucleotidase n=1 Tax=Mediterraneibacter faecis TaxID=592978 RepID=UPI0040296A7A
MKRGRKILALFLIITMLLPFVMNIPAEAAEKSKQLDVLFTHDTHSHLNSFSTIVDGEQKEVGGFAKLKTLIDEKKKENPDTLILDGGDFSMGTLIQTVYDTEAAELRMLGYLGCDVSTFGNHEFDYRSKGLADMLTAAKDSGETVPSLVVCNVDWDSMEMNGLSEGQKQIQSAFENYGVKDYVVVQKGDVKIAVVGVFGVDALKCAPTCELLFKDPVESVKKTVEEIKKNEKVDMIACVSHSGTWEDEKKSEDEILAKEVPDLDLIISGHTHTELKEPIQHGNTYIVSCGEYARNLGSLSMTQKQDGRWEMTSYELIPVSEDIEPDQATQERIDALMDTVDTNYLTNFGYTRDEVLAENDVEFNSLGEMETKHEELNLGDIMSDSYIYSVEHSEDYNGMPVDVAVVPSGCVRDTYTKGNITVEDVYNSFSLGIGKDGLAGYPLIDVYLTGKELKLAAEVDASVSDFMTTARLYCSGLNFTFNPHRMILNKVTDCYLTREDGERIEIQDDQLYRVVTDLYTGQMLGSVMEMSYGLLKIEPKDKDGNPIENLEDQAIMEGDKELKAWDAIARYMKSFDDTDGNGISNVPEYYETTHGRKVVDESRNVIDLVKNPNKFSVMIVGVVLVLILIIILLVVLIRKLIKKRRRKKK